MEQKSHVGHLNVHRSLIMTWYSVRIWDAIIIIQPVICVHPHNFQSRYSINFIYSVLWFCKLRYTEKKTSKNICTKISSLAIMTSRRNDAKKYHKIVIVGETNLLVAIRRSVSYHKVKCAYMVHGCQLAGVLIASITSLTWKLYLLYLVFLHYGWRLAFWLPVDDRLFVCLFVCFYIF